MSNLTKKALSQALKGLLMEMPLRKVTVGMISSRCGVNRQTFYYHFQDIADLLSWTVAQDAKEKMSYLKDEDVTWEEGFIALFGFLSEDKRFILNVYHSVGLETLQEYIYRVTAPALRKAIDEHPLNGGLSTKEKAFAADFYKYALAGIVLDWIKKGMAEDPKEIASMTFRMFDSPIRISHAEGKGN